MSERLENPFVPGGYTWVSQDMELLDVHHVDREIFPDWQPKVESVDFFHIIHIDFLDPESGEDELFFFMALKPEKEEVREDYADRLEFFIGTKNGGPRLRLYHETHLDSWPEGGLLINRFFFWQKIDPEDDIRIASERDPGVSHILDNSHRDGKGYQSPFSLTLSLRDDGVITLIPKHTQTPSRPGKHPPSPPSPGMRHKSSEL